MQSSLRLDDAENGTAVSSARRRKYTARASGLTDAASEPRPRAQVPGFMMGDGEKTGSFHGD